MLVDFDAVSRPMEFVDCGEVAEGIFGVQRGWTYRQVASGDLPAPIIRVRKTERGFVCVSPRLSTPSACREKIRTDVLRAVAVCHSELMNVYQREHNDLMCLHAGAVEFNGALVVLAGTHQAGKSTLVTGLAAAGVRVFCDDVLPIDTEGRGVAIGFVPRLRLPMADDLSRAFHDFVDARRGLENSRNLYMDLRDEECAPLDARAPVNGVVVLDRDPAAAPKITPIKKSEALKRLIVRKLAGDVAAVDFVDRLHGIAAGASCFSLRYAACDEAVRLLEGEFGSASARRAA